MKKIKILLGIILLSSVVACGNDKPKLELKKDTFTFELGEDVKLKPKEVIKSDDKEVLNNTKLNADISEKDFEDKEVYDLIAYNEDSNELQITNLPVGEYKGIAEYEDEKLEYKIIVKDTIAPEFVDFNEKIEVEQNSTEDLTTKFKIEDLSEATVSLDMEKVDLSKAGEYKTTVTAKDAYDNETTKDITIVVKEKATAEETDAETNEGSTASGTVDSSGTGTTGGSANTSGGTGSTSTGGTNTTPSNPTPAPSEPIVQLTSTPQPSFIFDTWDEAENYGYEIIGDPAKRQALAQKYGYRDVAQTSSFVVTDVSFGYASNGIEVYSKVAVYFNLVK